MKKILVIIFLIASIGCKEVKGNDNPPVIVETKPPTTIKEVIVETKPPIIVKEPPVYIVWGDEVIIESKKYLHVRETNGPNRSKEIDAFHDFSGLPYGNPWCLMYVNYVFGQVTKVYDIPFGFKTARVSQFLQNAIRDKYNYRVMYAKGLIYGVDVAQAGDLPVWVKGVNKKIEDNFNGHIGFVVEQISPTKIKTIEGNTSSGEAGSQRDGDGVFQRTRSIVLNGDFRIAAIVRKILPETEKNERRK